MPYTTRKYERSAIAWYFVKQANYLLLKTYSAIYGPPIAWGFESYYFKKGNHVLRVKKSTYYEHDTIFKRKELSIPQSKYFVNTIKKLPYGDVMEKLGEPIGTLHTLEHFDKKLIPFLKGLLKELQKQGINHHDINPSNILRTKNGYKLIDFSFARKKTDSYVLPEILNPSYSKDDQQAINKMIQEIDKELSRTNNS